MQRELTDGERELWDEMQADAVEYAVCEKCHGDMLWTDCWQIDCENGSYDAYEEDCINNDPGTWMTCETCEGKGGWWYCPTCAKK